MKGERGVEGGKWGFGTPGRWKDEGADGTATGFATHLPVEKEGDLTLVS